MSDVQVVFVIHFDYRCCTMASRVESWMHKFSWVRHITSVLSTWWTTRSTLEPEVQSKFLLDNLWKDGHGESMRKCTGFPSANFHDAWSFLPGHHFISSSFALSYQYPIAKLCLSYSLDVVIVGLFCLQWWRSSFRWDGARLYDCTRCRTVPEWATIRSVRSLQLSRV